jgi:hypothetical protein
VKIRHTALHQYEPECSTSLWGVHSKFKMYWFSAFMHNFWTQLEIQRNKSKWPKITFKVLPVDRSQPVSIKQSLTVGVLSVIQQCHDISLQPFIQQWTENVIVLSFVLVHIGPI